MNTLLRLIVSPFWALQRRIDMKVLWPACKAQAKNLDEARAAFAAHAFCDACWIDYYGEKALRRHIDTLE
jgi:hypothetical protein